MTDELEQLRQRRLAELQQQQAQQQSQPQAQYEQAAKMQEAEQMKQNLLRQILTPDARERLNTLKMAKPELVAQLEGQLVGLAQSGRVKSVIDDAQLKGLLKQVQPKKREMSITPVSYTHLRAHETRHDLVCRLL